MDGTVSVSGVGAVASSTQIQTSYQAKMLKMEQDTMKDLGASALKLIQASFVPTPTDVGNDLDISG
jgi:hypothetical protein